MTDPSAPVPAAVPITADPPELAGPTLLGQGWRDLTFLHWRVDPARVEPLLPAGTAPDVFDGSTWVGLIPFQLVGAHLGTGPALPYVGTFPETNVRFYSTDGEGRHGVVFGSLDAARLPFVVGARMALGLNYAWSRMRVERSGAVIRYTSRRRWPAPRGARSDVRVQVTAEVVDDALAHFLTARWGLHTRHLGRTFFLPNTHARWPLQRAHLVSVDDELLAASGFADLAGRAPDSVLYSAGVRTRFGAPQPVRGAPAVATMPG
ncbi:MAG TPA: DUF2071 domain-containing protein [Propionibacteriaceae bacterium]|nr:DUF2071 domain-containing protein [Propionibacteriaceae bacterium]